MFPMVRSFAIKFWSIRKISVFQTWSEGRLWIFRMSGMAAFIQKKSNCTNFSIDILFLKAWQDHVGPNGWLINFGKKNIGKAVFLEHASLDTSRLLGHAMAQSPVTIAKRTTTKKRDRSRVKPPRPIKTQSATI